VGDVGVGAGEPPDDTAELRSACQVRVDQVMHRTGRCQNGHSGVDQSFLEIRDGAVPPQIDRGDLNDGITGGIGARGLDIDAAQGHECFFTTGAAEH
jgi:hypothetical protein